MDNLVSAAVSRSGSKLPSFLGTKVASLETWNLYDAAKPDDGSPVSVFEYDFIHPLNEPLARNALRNLRTVRHPDVLKFIDAVESDSAILIMTERVRPLSIALRIWESKSQQERQDWLLWGLHRISTALAFINDSVASIHGRVTLDAIFISSSGEWKLGGFEALRNPKDDDLFLCAMDGLLPCPMSCVPPEVRENGWTVLKDGPISAIDSYALGLLLHSVFNLSLLPDTGEPPRPPPPPCGSISFSVFLSVRKLLVPNPKDRMTPKMFLDAGMAETVGDGSGFFFSNRLVKVCSSLCNFTSGSEMEKAMLLRMVKESASSFPPEFFSFRILPSLVDALEYGGISAATILPLVLQYGMDLPLEEYMHVVIGPLIKLFANPDRGIRMALLDNLSEYADKLDRKMVDKIWLDLQSGFTDTVPVIREATMRAIVHFSPKISYHILNSDLLWYLERLQDDPHAYLRTKACILIGQLNPILDHSTKRKVFIPAFSKALKDPFVHARVAGVMAFMWSAECFNIGDVATEIFPSIVRATLDKEKIVRDQAFKAMELFTKRLETYAASMPETAPAKGEGNATLSASEGFTEASLADWATRSAFLGEKFSPSDLQGTITGTSLTSPIGSTSNHATQLRGFQLGISKMKQATATQLAETPGDFGNNISAYNHSVDAYIEDGWSTVSTSPSADDLGCGALRSSSTKGEDEWAMDTLASPSRGSNVKRSPSLPPSHHSRTHIPSPKLNAMSNSWTVISPVLSSPRTSISSLTRSVADLECVLIPCVGASVEERTEKVRRKEERRMRIRRQKEQKKYPTSMPS